MGLPVIFGLGRKTKSPDENLVQDDGQKPKPKA